MGLVFLENNTDLGEVDNLGNTLLHTAALGACLKSYKRLIALGADREAVNQRGKTAYKAAQELLEYKFHSPILNNSERARKGRADGMQIFLSNAGTNQPNLIVH